MNKAILILGICIFLVACGVPSPCVVGQQNETHFCNEYHNWERKDLGEENLRLSEEMLDKVTRMEEYEYI